MATHLHVFCRFALAWFTLSVAAAAPFQDGHLAEVVNDVRLTEPDGRMTHVGAKSVVEGGAIQTGAASRAEVRFRDQSVLRIGDNTRVGFQPNSRTFELTSGAVLTQVPPAVGRTSLRVGAITATVTGTTLVVEALPNAYTKFISLDGTSRLCLETGEWGRDCVLLRAGQMVIAAANPKSLPGAADVDLNRLIETCQFITDFPALPGENRLVKAADAQRKRKSHGKFADTNLVIFGRGTLVSQKTSAVAPAENGTGSPSPSATPR